MVTQMKGTLSKKVLEKLNSGIALALKDAIELLPNIDRTNVYVMYNPEPPEGDYPYRVGYDHNGIKEWWAGPTFKIAVGHLAETMSPAGIAERRRMNVPIPGEVN
jgi:hypothetical protein